MAVYEQTAAAAAEICEKAHLKPGSILVVGCSTSEVVGARIGTNSSVETAEEIARALLDVTKSRGIFLAVQCCEHLNRAIITERAAARRSSTLSRSRRRAARSPRGYTPRWKILSRWRRSGRTPGWTSG